MGCAMKTSPKHVLVMVLVAGFGASACSPDGPAVAGRRLAIEPAEAETLAITNAKAMARELWGAQQWLDESEPIDHVTDVLFPESEEDVEVSGGAFLPQGLFLPNQAEEFEDFLKDLEEVLADKIFVDANIESQKSDEIIYHLDLNAFCQLGDVGEESADPHCADAVAGVPLRARVTRRAANDVDITVLVGEARLEAAVLELHHDLVALSVNLTAAREIALALAEDIVEEATGDAAIALDGTFKLSVRRLTEDQIRLAGDVTRDIVVSLTTDDDEGRGALSLARGGVALDVDAGRGTALLDVDLGRLAVETSKQVWADSNVECWETETETPDGDVICAEECDEAPDVVGSVAFSLDRCAFLVNLSDVAGSLALSGLLLGPATLRSDEATAFEATIDDSKTPVDVDFGTAPDTVTLTLSRATAAGVLLRMSLLADVLDDMPKWMADEQLGMAMGGAAPSVLVDGQQLHVVAGTLTLTSRNAPRPEIVVDAGQCLWRPDSEEAGGVDPESGSEETEDGHVFDLENGTCQEPEPEPT